MHNYLIKRYELLQVKADKAFEDMEKDYKNYIRCKKYCSDCCYAMFGLFAIEAFYIKRQFDKLDAKVREAALVRAKETEKQLHDLDRKLREGKKKSKEQSQHSLSSLRIRCPLLDEKDECVLYEYRPLTCRVYGIPTSIHGKAHVCWKSDFKPGESYPVYNLDEAYQELYYLSRQLLSWEDAKELGKASLLISVSKCISTPTEELFEQVFK